MAKRRSSPPNSSYLRKLAYFLAALFTGSGAGGLAFPEIPVIGPAVKAAVEQFRAFSSGAPSNANTAPMAGGPTPPANPVSMGPSAAALPASTAAVPNYGQAAPPPRDTILIGSFNIQVFGTSKLQKRPTIDVIAAVVRSFDLVAIQEIRTQDDHFLDQFIQMVNSQGGRHSYVIGPRLGRSSSKEQYAFIYDTNRIEVRPPSVVTLNDPSDLLHREPLIAQFRTRDAPPAEAFTFWLVDIHTDPDEVASEVDVLAEAYQVVQQQGDDDVILLGDLNASEHQLGALGRLPGMRYAIAGVPTNTRGTKTYDNILFDARSTVEYTGQSGVWNLMTAFGLTQEQALEVSDHFPVWAIFSIYEGGRQPLATRPAQPR